MFSPRFLSTESAIDLPTDDDYVDENAIDDENFSDWEDSVQDSDKSSVEANLFKRVEPKVNLVSRSLIALMLAQTERVPKEPQQQASHSASASKALRVSPNDNDEGPLMLKDPRPSNPKPIIEVPRWSNQPTVAQAVSSPQTTRRNMLSTEIPEYRRRHIPWERPQKTSTANAVLKRRHASHNVANQRQFPEKPYLKQSEDANARSWNQHFTTIAFDGYHSRGW